MQEVNLRNIDLNLLVILLELLKSKHITLASKNLGMSQSATSRALSRLRDMLNDSILIRTQTGYILSKRAQQLLPELQQTINSIQQMIQATEFNPAISKEVIKLFGVDLEIISYLPAFYRLVHKNAPHLKLSVITGTQDHFELLKSGEIQFSLTALTPKAGETKLRRMPLSKEKTVCIVRRNHPISNGRMSLKKYLSYKHGMINLIGKGEGSIDRILRELGKEREVSIRLPNFTSAAYFCESSDLVFLMPENIANELVKRHDLEILPSPKELQREDSSFYLYWHERNHSDPLCVWLREQFKASLKDQPHHYLD